VVEGRVTPVTPTVTPTRCSRLPHGVAYSSHTLGVTQGHARLRLTASYKEQDAREGLALFRESPRPDPRDEAAERVR